MLEGKAGGGCSRWIESSDAAATCATAVCSATKRRLVVG